MIVGIGVDLINVQRIQTTIERFGNRFMNRLFLDSEKEYVEKRLASSPKNKEQYMRQKALHSAKLYAAKEAVLKALGTGLANGISWHHIEIIRLPSGQPTVKLHAAAANYLKKLAFKGQVHLSLTDEWPYVQAYVVISHR